MSNFSISILFLSYRYSRYWILFVRNKAVRNLSKFRLWNVTRIHLCRRFNGFVSAWFLLAGLSSFERYQIPKGIVILSVTLTLLVLNLTGILKFSDFKFLYNLGSLIMHVFIWWIVNCILFFIQNIYGHWWKCGGLNHFWP